MLTPMGYGWLSAAFIALEFAGLWLVFAKAGRSGWAALIPIYNLFVLVEIVDRSEWYVLWLFIPLVNIVAWFIVCLDLAEAFGHGSWYALGLFLVPSLFLLVLGFGSSSYHKPRPAAVGSIEF